MLVHWLDEAIGDAFESFAADALKQATISGEIEQGLDPPRDVVSFVLDHMLPIVLMRIDDSKAERIEELRQLARDLDFQTYMSLLAVYADQRGDREGVRRAWDAFTNSRSPLRRMFSDFQHRSRGGIARAAAASSKSMRNSEIIAQGLQMEREGKTSGTATANLAAKYGLSKRRIRDIRSSPKK